MKADLIVTQHDGLVSYLRDEYNIDVPCIDHANVADVVGKVVVGVLPIYLAAYAKLVITIPLHTPRSLRRTELTAEQVAKFAGTPQYYVVQKVEGESYDTPSGV